MNVDRMFSWAVILAVVAAPMGLAAEGGASSVTIDFAKSAGKIRALNGVNNGPVSWGAADDLTGYHKEAGFPSVRLHDCPYAGANVVDIHFIFPIFDADADNPMYYNFAETDAYIGGIVECGEKIMYRLGESIESRSRAYSNGGFHVQPPKDFAKWAKICVNIIRHYNEGWANGFHYNITNWEIWNEPGELIPGMWPGTQQQYFDLYAITAKAIKDHDPAMKVGGPTVCNIGFPLIRPFLEFCRDKALPLDFVTWHCYAAAPQEIAAQARTARKLFDDCGFTKAESHITEWHPMWYSWDNAVDANKIAPPDPAKFRAMREKFDTMRGPKAAAFVASTLMLLQDCPLDMANYYTADVNPWGMFDSFGVPGKVYFTFVAFNRLMKTPNRVTCEPQGEAPPEVTMCAGLSDDGKSASILVSNFGETPHAVTIHVQNLPLPQPVEAETFAVDATHELASLGTSALASDQTAITLELPAYRVNLVKLGAPVAK